MFCSKCGKKLDLHDKFCTNCGEPVILETAEEAKIIPEPPKDLVWNVEGFPKEKKVEDIIFDWKTESQGEDFIVDDFYIGENKNVSVQKLLDEEMEKINKKNKAREEAIALAQATTVAQATTMAQAAIMGQSEPMLNSDFQVNLGSEQKTDTDPEPEPNTDPEPEPNPYPEPNTDPEPDQSIPENLKTEPEISTTGSENEESLNIANKRELKYEDIFVEEEEQKSKGFSFAKFLIVILILLVLLEGVFLGFKYYNPNNPYFKIVDEKVSQAVMTLESWFQVKEPVDEEPAVEEPVIKEPANEEPIVEEPITEQPINQFPENKNIKEVTMNSSLVYVSGKDYNNADINKSLPVIENTDQVINTVVEYDSKWIDYVNSGNKDVVDLTLAGSPAEKNTLSFTKVCKIKETFNSLEIGEVRKGTKGYYVWVREEIEIFENNINTTKTYNWIYQIVPVENQMKIVNYFSY